MTSSGGTFSSLMFGMKRIDRKMPSNADRNVDEEDPAPVEIGGDEAAENRPEDRSHHGRNGQRREGLDDLVAGDASQQNEPPDRHHHGAAHALHEAGDNEPFEGIRRGAGEGPGHEHPKRGRENGLGPELVGHPARNRDEDGKSDKVGGERQFQRDRVLADIPRDHRQRRGNHRRVGVFHEERGGDDQGEKARGSHGFAPFSAVG